LSIYDLLIKCEVPVIAAMQGHALGGGMVFGSSADIMVMAEECIYSTNFMKYGFTPGVGATYIIPKKFGQVLGTEMLMTARNYYGGELKERGAAAKIVRKVDVIDTAMEIAQDLSAKPLISLKILKDHLTRQIRLELPDIIERELEMHRITFTQPEVTNMIEKHYFKGTKTGTKHE
jgi:polyketide biosynthesis enoyl-CoA hydratase PksI